MNLLRWMRTIKQNGLHSSKDFKGGLCCLRPQVSSEVQGIRTNSFSFSRPSHDPNPPEIDEELRVDEDSFKGFLAIGTLGRDPETPKFAALVGEEEMAKLVNKKLDKFLEEYSEDTSSKRIERLNAKGDRETDESPRQGCVLFRSSIGLAKRRNEAKKNKGLLTSLFKGRQRVQGESYMEKHAPKDLIKRIFEKLHGSSSKMRNDDDDGDDSVPKKKDLRKSVQIFRSKVHPVLYTPARDNNKIDDRRSCINRYDLKVPGGFLGSSSISISNRKRENWIKTDAEYLVLEL